MQGFWFGLIAVVWAVFFALEGFDFGVGILLPFISRGDEQRKVALRSIGPVWDGNEVWLLLAGGATFAAFPAWYASMFSGFYLAFALLLAGLIMRGIGIEYRSKAQTDSGRRWCDVTFFVGSVVPAILLGVTFANLLRGLRMDANHDVTASFGSLLSPFALLGGLVTLALCTFHGAIYLMLRTTGEVRDATRRLLPALTGATGVLAVLFLAWASHLRGSGGSFILAGLIVTGFLLAAAALRTGREGRAFAASAVMMLLVPAWIFAALWPLVLPASNNPAWSLTIHNASSSPYTLRVMTVVALVMTPIVLIYQAWTYWVFRARVTGADVSGDGYGGGRFERTVRRARDSAAELLGTADHDHPSHHDRQQ